MERAIGLIFDMDGVLVHSNPAHEQTIREFCKKFNQDVSDKFLREKIFGRTNKEWIPELFGRLSKEKTEELANEKEQMFRDRFDPKAFEIAGIRQFLAKLQSGSYQCVLATSAPGDNADFILSELNLQNHFSVILDSSDVTKGKPDPEIYLKAASELNLPPSRCIVFEDSLAGVQAGMAAGCIVVGIASTHTAEELKNCSVVVNNFEELSIEEVKELLE